jgi:hypothetical protein
MRRESLPCPAAGSAQMWAARRIRSAHLSSVNDAKGADCAKKMKPRFGGRDLGFAKLVGL